MKKMIWIFDILAVTCIFLSVCIGVSVAQPLPYSLSGHIMDNESNYIVGAEITLLNKRTGDTLELVSSTNGEYQQDAYNFAAHYKNHDMIWYTVIYGEIGATEKAKIDISKGGTMLDIVLTIEDSPKMTPDSTPKTKAPRQTTAHMYDDTDGDGFSDNEERVKGWDKNDPCIPNSDSVACKGKVILTPQLTPEVFSPVKEKPTPIPTPVAIPKSVPVPVEPVTEIPGFTGLMGVVSILVVVLYKKKKEVKVGLKEDDDVKIKKKCIGCREKTYNFLIGKEGRVRGIRKENGKYIYDVEVDARLYTFTRQAIAKK